MNPQLPAIKSILLPDGAEIGVTFLLDIPQDFPGLAEAMEKQPSNYATIAILSADVRKLVHEAEQQEIVARARAAREARSVLKAAVESGGKPPTEAAIKEYVDCHEVVVMAAKDRILLGNMLDRLDAIKRALEHKKDMLVSLVREKRIESDSDMRQMQHIIDDYMKKGVPK